MRIGITCYPTYGGSGAIATELGLELARKGHEVHLISYASPFRLRGFEERVTFHEVTIGNYPLFEYMPYDLALAVKQHEVALRERLDILHVHYAIPHATAAWLAKQMLGDDHKLQVVTTLHGTDITLVGQERSYFTVTQFSIERSDAVTAVSQFLRDETYRAFGCGNCDIRVIPNFVNFTEYHPPTAEGCRPKLAPKDNRVLIHVSNFRPVKRVLDVIRIFAGVRKAVPSTLVMVGDGPERPEAEAEADRLGVGRHVRFLGKVNSVADLMRSSDLLLLPSETESFGLVALEAMACGVPVVATRTGGLPEVVADGETGALAPVGAVDELTARATEILKDRTAWRRYSDAAASRAREFSAANVVPQYEELYQELLDA
jgi:L-malate glycosyltransferase